LRKAEMAFIGYKYLELLLCLHFNIITKNVELQ
jgi:hypothetical protein